MSATLGAQIIPFTPRPEANARTRVGTEHTGEPNVAPSGPENQVGSAVASDQVLASEPGSASASALSAAQVPASASGPTSLSPTALAQRAAQERLARALARLNEALADQRAAIAGWRGAMIDLSNSMHSLRRGVQEYQSNLTTLDRKVAGLRAEAERLGRWADAALANGKPPRPDRKE